MKQMIALQHSNNLKIISSLVKYKKSINV